MSLNDQVCIMTGAGSGIGRAAALLMADAGARMVLVGRTRSKLDQVQEQICESGGRAEAYELDVQDHAAVSAMAKDVVDRFGRIDVLVNNAGHSSPHRKLLTTTPEEMQSVLGTNLLGAIFCAQAVVPSMLEVGRGTIINVSSMAGVSPGLIGGMVYSAAKAGLINFTGFLNYEFKNTGIRASVVIPGEVDTPTLDARPVVPDSEARETMATVDDVAEAIAMIAGLSDRTTVPELIIRPTYLRDFTSEEGTA